MFDSNGIDSEDAGVSPVIGVILMVAITVILAAVIGTFVLDLAGNVNQSANASFTFSESANIVEDTSTAETGSDTHYDVTATLVSKSAGDDFHLEAPEYTKADTDSDSTSGSDTDTWQATGNTQESGDMSTAGDTATVTAVDASDSVTVVGTLEGSSTVVQTYTVEGE